MQGESTDFNDQNNGTNDKQQLFDNLAADGLSQSDLEKLKLIVPTTQGNAAYLTQAFGLSFEDSDKLALAIKLLSTLPIPSKLLNIKTNLKSPASKPNSSHQMKSHINPVVPVSVPSSYPSYPPTPFSMYPYHQVNPYAGNPMPSSGGGSKIPSTGQSQTTLYVRNLPSTAKEEEILAVFQNFGAIKEARFQKSKETHEFFGSVFIEYIHASAARLAHVQLNEKSWGDRTVYIDFAKERVAPKDEKADQGAPTAPSNSIYISGLPSDCDKNFLMQMFSRFGTIIDARPLRTEAGNSKGIAFIDFALVESSAAAIDALDNTFCQSKMIKVNYAANSTKRKAADGVSGFDQDMNKKFRTEPGYPGMYGYDMSAYAQGGASIDPSQWYGQQYY
jgi:RNA recognition motif-containing protein